MPSGGMSGIKLCAESSEIIQAAFKSSSTEKFQAIFIDLKVENGTEIAKHDPCRSICGDELTFDAIRKELLSKPDPAWVVFKFQASLKDDRKLDEIVLLSWCPEVCPVKKKMTFASTTEEVKRNITFKYYIPANDTDDLSLEHILDSIKDAKDAVTAFGQRICKE